MYKFMRLYRVVHCCTLVKLIFCKFTCIHSPSSYGEAVSIIPYQGLVTTDGGLTLRTTMLAAVGAFYDEKGDGKVFVFAKAAAGAEKSAESAGSETEKEGEQMPWDLGAGWFYQQQLTHNTTIESNKKAFFGVSVR